MYTFKKATFLTFLGTESGNELVPASSRRTFAPADPIDTFTKIPPIVSSHISNCLYVQSHLQQSVEVPLNPCVFDRKYGSYAMFPC